MYQLSFLKVPDVKSIVNVASVPQYSPFRYPGGKTWLVPHFKNWIDGLPFKPRLLVEPFCGGAGIGLTALIENLATKVVLCELDPHVSAVWRVLAKGDAEALARRILQYPLDKARVSVDLACPPVDLLDHAFKTILRNRVQRGGIMAPGASLMKLGENGAGIASRWYPQTLARRIRLIAAHRDRLTFIEGDAIREIPKFLDQKRTAFFIDPPYTAGGKLAGHRLYGINHVNHDRLFQLASKAKGPVMLTYDDNPVVRRLARDYGFRIEEVPMKSTHHASMIELVITNTPL